MPIPKQTPILIVGAGPNGLACAITLANLGHKVTIVDALGPGKRRVGARSALTHAWTFEVCYIPLCFLIWGSNFVSKQVLKSVDPKLASSLADSEFGIQSTGVVFCGGDEPLFDANVANLSSSTEFPYILL